MTVHKCNQEDRLKKIEDAGEQVHRKMFIESNGDPGMYAMTKSLYSDVTEMKADIKVLTRFQVQNEAFMKSEKESKVVIEEMKKAHKIHVRWLAGTILFTLIIILLKSTLSAPLY